MSNARMKLPEALRGAYRAACRSGWSVTRTGSGHLKWAPPEGQFIITGATPRGGRRSVDNALDRLREAGLKC